mmetsp:Transcript_10051/g.14754  ORF Transcript_10051/g.14754 Transcript_10051/m.14754 type:complete len:94 (+) Transcript_10051:774-1055(+)
MKQPPSTVSALCQPLFLSRRVMSSIGLWEPMLKDFKVWVFLKIDVDENHETAAKYSVSAMPTFVFIKKGDVVDRLMGANAQRLQSMIEEIAGI